jgi:L-iditol 2-dehydrogenase
MTDFTDTFAAMIAGRLGPLDWFEMRGLDAGAQAFADIRAGRAEAPKIVLRPS